MSFDEFVLVVGGYILIAFIWTTSPWYRGNSPPPTGSETER